MLADRQRFFMGRASERAIGFSAVAYGQKVTILLEELLALNVIDAEYDAWLIRIGEGDQFSSGHSAPEFWS
jgi:glutathione S-transferase